MFGRFSGCGQPRATICSLEIAFFLLSFIEVISSVYEELLSGDSKDMVYTPEMLVNLMVDECMPLREPQKNFKMIDVICGSGIFLVKAYKRMIQWCRYNEWKKLAN